MPILQANNVTMANLTRIFNSTSIDELAINVNTYVYAGIFMFVMLWLLWFVLFVVLQKKDNQPLPNLLMSGGIVSVVSILLRFVYVIDSGWRGLLTEGQMWIFPIITVVLAMIAWMTKEE